MGCKDGYKRSTELPGYKNKLERQRSVTNLDEAVITGKGKILGKDVVIAVMGADFMMGSMGEVVGEKITRAVERATQMRLPIIIFTCSVELECRKESYL